jgi:hypothetical protein
VGGFSFGFEFCIPKFSSGFPLISIWSGSKALFVIGRKTGLQIASSNYTPSNTVDITFKWPESIWFMLIMTFETIGDVKVYIDGVRVADGRTKFKHFTSPSDRVGLFQTRSPQGDFGSLRGFLGPFWVAGSPLSHEAAVAIGSRKVGANDDSSLAGFFNPRVASNHELPNLAGNNKEIASFHRIGTPYLLPFSRLFRGNEGLLRVLTISERPRASNEESVVILSDIMGMLHFLINANVENQHHLEALGGFSVVFLFIQILDSELLSVDLWRKLIHLENSITFKPLLLESWTDLVLSYQKWLDSSAEVLQYYMHHLSKFAEQYLSFMTSLLPFPVLLSIIWHEFCVRKVDAPLRKLWIAILVQAYPGIDESH